MVGKAEEWFQIAALWIQTAAEWIDKAAVWIQKAAVSTVKRQDEIKLPQIASKKPQDESI